MKLDDGISLIISVLVLYIAISCFRYSLYNPELTQMQIFLNFKKAMLWE